MSEVTFQLKNMGQILEKRCKFRACLCSFCLRLYVVCIYYLKLILELVHLTFVVDRSQTLNISVY